MAAAMHATHMQPAGSHRGFDQACMRSLSDSFSQSGLGAWWRSTTGAYLQTISCCSGAVLKHPLNSLTRSISAPGGLSLHSYSSSAGAGRSWQQPPGQQNMRECQQGYMQGLHLPQMLQLLSHPAPLFALGRASPSQLSGEVHTSLGRGSPVFSERFEEPLSRNLNTSDIGAREGLLAVRPRILHSLSSSSPSLNEDPGQPRHSIVAEGGSRVDLLDPPGEPALEEYLSLPDYSHSLHRSIRDGAGPESMCSHAPAPGVAETALPHAGQMDEEPTCRLGQHEIANQAQDWRSSDCHQSKSGSALSATVPVLHEGQGTTMFAKSRSAAPLETVSKSDQLLLSDLSAGKPLNQHGDDLMVRVLLRATLLFVPRERIWFRVPT